MAKNTSIKLQDQARNLYSKGDFLKAIGIWEILAKSGDAESFAWLGSCYANGDGVEANDEKALELYESAAKKGNVLAQSNAGAFYFMGRGVVKDIKKGLFWLEKAASNNDVNGLFNLAQIYFQGDYLPLQTL